MFTSTDVFGHSPSNAVPSVSRRILDLLQSQAVLRPRDLADLGIPPKYLDRLYKAGRVQRVGRGLYTALNGSHSEYQTLVEAQKRVPNGVVCLLSALRFHDLTTQNPFEIWLMIGVKDRTPFEPSLPLHIMRASGAARTAGVDQYVIDGVPLRVYDPAKTIADCFKYRTKIGLDVAIEALQDGWRQRRVTMVDLWNYAKIDRVGTVMRPYLESLQ